MFAGDLAYHARRPLFIVWALILVLCRLGNVDRVDDDPDPATRRSGGTKAFVTSEFAVAMQVAVVTLLFYGFFVAVAAGMTVIQDDQWRMGELIHATPLRPVSTSGASSRPCWPAVRLILALHLAAMLFFNHVLPNAEAQEMRGPLRVLNYLETRHCCFRCRRSSFWPGISFAVGEWTRRPILVFLLAGGGRARRRILPLGMVAELARPPDQRRPDVDRPVRVPLAE